MTKDENLFAEECIELTGRISNILNSYMSKSKILNESEQLSVIVTVLADHLANTFTFNKADKKDVIDFFERRYDHNIKYKNDIKEEIGEA